MVDILQYAAANSEVRRELDRERYYMEAMDDIFGEREAIERYRTTAYESKRQLLKTAAD